MRIPRVYLDAPLAVGQVVTLPANVAKHLGKVLRLPAGAELILFNGQGGEWRAELSFEQAVAQATPRQFVEAASESPLTVTLLQGIGRGERMDYAIQKAVELGVSAIQPIFSERTVVKLSGDRLQKRQQHWHAVAVAASEQSGRCVVPAVLPALNLSAALAIEADAKWVLAPTAVVGIECEQPPSRAALLIGPEGGLSAAEIDAALAAGWLPWQLGPRVLRTETAGSAALAVLQARWGDF